MFTKLSFILLLTILSQIQGQIFPSKIAFFLQGHGPNIKPAIVGGDEAKPHSLPFQAALFLKLGTSDQTGFCGGSLISPNHVLTAAHCVSGIQEALVVLGAHNISRQEPSQQYQFSKNFVVHNKWNPSNLRNDIAVITLPQSAQITNEVQTIPLPRSSDAYRSLFLRQATVSGWGKDSDKATYITDTLRVTRSKIISNIICQMKFLGTITSSQICLDGLFGKSPCNGDSGGPLTLEENKKPVLHGVVSFGIILGCQKGFPSVFTRVSKYLPWINSVTGIPISN